MSLSLCLGLIGVGLAVGIISGMIGIGGGVFVIPALMLIFGLSQARANGTSLAMMLPPIGIFAVLAYARAGNVEWRFAALLAVGFAAGAYVGARLVNAQLIHPTALRVAFSALLMYLAARILFRAGGRAGAATETLVLTIWFIAAYLVMRLLGGWLGRSESRWGDMYRQRLRKTVEQDYEI
jgi:uncharacterized membrane protein YfcA